MGQKVSTSESNSDNSFSKKDSNPKPKKLPHHSEAGKSLKESIFNLKNEFEDDNRSGRPRAMGEDEEIPDDEIIKGSGQKLSYCYADATNSFAGYQNSKPNVNGVPLAFVANPSVAELSQLTALRMVRNFEELSRIDHMLVNQVHELNDDNLSEKDFSTISYEDFPAEQLGDNPLISKRDSSTYTTVENKEHAADNNVATAAASIEKILSCKESQDDDYSDPAAARNWKPSKSPTRGEKKAPWPVPGPWRAPPGLNDTTISNSSYDTSSSSSSSNSSTSTAVTIVSSRRSTRLLDGAGDYDRELAHLKERLGRLENERDEARLRMIAAEEKCLEHETESLSLQATLDTLETKLRNISEEVHQELRNSRKLQKMLLECSGSHGTNPFKSNELVP